MEKSVGKYRLLSIDIIRVAAFALIILYHYFINLGIVGLGPELPYGNQNMHIATLGVALFFIVSGFGLMISADAKWKGCKSFYKKRFTRILLPFYIVWFIYFVIQFFVKKGWPFVDGTPLRNFIYTVLGMDEYMAMLGKSTFGLYIGEWFLGCLVIMYLLFPLLRYLMEKQKVIFISVITVVWLVLVIWNPFVVVPHMNIYFKLYEFILGMFLAKVYKKVKKTILIATVPIILAFLVLPVAIPIPTAILITIFSMAVFMTILSFEPNLPKGGKLEGVLKICSKYSFELYLVHHVVIYDVTNWFVGNPFNKKEIIVLFVLEFLIMVILAKVVVRLKEMIEEYLLKLKTYFVK